MDISNYELDYENEFEDKELEEKEVAANLTGEENEVDEKNNANDDTNADLDTSEDDLSNEEKLVNYWIEKEYLMINPEEDKIESMEDALRIDAERRTDFIKDKLIEQFPEDFRILADGVINHGVKDIRKILELMAGNTANESSAAVTEEKAIETLKAHYTDLGYDADEIDMDVASLKSKNKLIPAAERLIARQNEVENKQKQLEMQQEVERQKIAEAENVRQYQEHQNLIANEFKQKTWKDDAKRQIAEEYFKGVTVEKVKHLLTNPTTAADFAMLVSRMFRTDDKGTISLNMDSLVDLASAKEAKNIKNKMQQKAFGSPVRFGNVKRASQPDLDSDYDFTI